MVREKLIKKKEKRREVKKKGRSTEQAKSKNFALLFFVSNFAKVGFFVKILYSFYLSYTLI